MSRSRMHVGFALKSPETRKACAAFEEVAAALDMFDTLPVPVLEALRDHVADQAKDQIGPRAEFMRAFATYLEGPLNDARVRDRRETFGVYRELR